MILIRKYFKQLIVFTLIIVFSIFIISQIQSSYEKPTFEPVSFHQLPGWENTNHLPSLKVFQKSCKKLLHLPHNKNVGSLYISLKAGDWQGVCHALNRLKNPNKKEAKIFFEQWFKPYAVYNQWRTKGLFTGYYLPNIKGNLTKNAEYFIPIYGRPSDLVMVDLGKFKNELKGQQLAGHIINGKLYPYPFSRKAINQGKLDKKTPVIAWTNNRIDRFFLQVQGSGKLSLPNGKNILLGYHATNGFPYKSIGKVLIQKREIPKEKVSMESIKQWLYTHPKEATHLLNENQSFVFFRKLKGNEPIGTQSVPLTPGYSLATDRRIIPLGMPLWLNTKVPTISNPNKTHDFKRLMIAQDTGGAIRGIVRGDIYWGEGNKAMILAGNMKHSGRYWIFLPRKKQK